jgi:DNA-binding CsgD family transcriptional regulator
MSGSTSAPYIVDDATWDNLTAAELKVIRLVADGLTSKASLRPCTCRFTVETHLKHAFAKVGVSSSAALAAQAVHRGMQLAADSGARPGGDDRAQRHHRQQIT